MWWLEKKMSTITMWWLNLFLTYYGQKSWWYIISAQNLSTWPRHVTHVITSKWIRLGKSFKVWNLRDQQIRSILFNFPYKKYLFNKVFHFLYNIWYLLFEIIVKREITLKKPKFAFWLLIWHFQYFRIVIFIK